MDLHTAATAVSPSNGNDRRGWSIVGIHEVLRQHVGHLWTQVILLAAAWGIPYAAINWVKITDYWQLALVSVPAIIFSFYAVLGRVDKFRCDWKTAHDNLTTTVRLNKIKLESQERLAEIAERHKAEEADKVSLAMQLAAETKKAAQWQTNHTNALTQIRDLLAERDEAQDRAEQASRAAADAHERSLESFKLLQAAETRSQNLQLIIDAMSEDKRKNSTMTATGGGVHDASATDGPVKAT